MSPGSPAAVHDAEARPGEPCPPLRVCHIASGDLWAGAEVQVAGLLRELKRRSDVEVRAIFLNEGRLAEESRRAGVEVSVIPESEHGFLGLVAKVSATLRERPVDILHSHRYKENLLAAWAARRGGIARLVRTQHGMPEPFSGASFWKQRLLQAADRLLARYGTDAVIAVSGDMEARLASFLGDRHPVLIYNGVDPTSVRSDLSREQAKQRLGVPPEAPVLGTAGRLEPVKRLDIFLRAAQRIAQAAPEAHFLIVGAGRESEALRKLAGELGLARQTHFTGHRSDLYDVLRAMDILVLSSDHEGLPMVLLEALGLGVPVVSRKVGGIPEVLTESSGGLLVDSSSPQALAESCLSLVHDPSRRETMGRWGRSRIERSFSAQRMAEATAALYRRLVTGGRSCGSC